MFVVLRGRNKIKYICPIFLKVEVGSTDFYACFCIFYLFIIACFIKDRFF